MGGPFKMKGWSPFTKKDPTKTLEEAKSNVANLKDYIKYTEEGEKTPKKAGGSIYQDRRLGTGETKFSKKAKRKVRKSEKKITKAEEALAQGKTKKAERKARKAKKKTYKGYTHLSNKGPDMALERTIQEKYKNDPRYQG